MFNPSEFEPVGKKFHIASQSLFGTNTKRSQFLNCCLLGIDLESLEGHPHPSIGSLVRRVSHFFLSRSLPGFQKTLGPRCQMLLHPFLTFVHSCAKVSWVLALYVLPEVAGKILKVSQFFFVLF